MNPATLYRCRDGEGKLLYVGASMYAAARLQQHQDKPWWPDVVRVELEHFDSVEDATAAEMRAIASEGPLHNRQPGRVLTEDQLAARRQRKVDAEERARERRVEQTKKEIAFERSTYFADAFCANCGHGGESSGLRFPKGVTVEEHACSQCGVVAFKRKAA